MRRIALLVAFVVGLCFPSPNAQNRDQDTGRPEDMLNASTGHSRATFSYHTHEGWSSVLELPMGTARDYRFTVGFEFASDADLPREHPANRLHLESHTVSTTRLGLRLVFARHTVYATLAWAPPAVRGASP